MEREQDRRKQCNGWQPPIGVARIQSIRTLVIGVCALALSLSTFAAQDLNGLAAKPAPLGEAQAKAAYQNCPNGFYNGPRPGRTNYVKDGWFWAVTPAFAKNFCMPPEFVSNELKGAEAVAYKLIEDQDEEVCNRRRGAEACEKRVDHRFEIYYRHGTIPREFRAPYFHGPSLPSALLLTSAAKEGSFAIESAQKKPRWGALNPFYDGQFELRSVGLGKTASPLGSLSPWIYYEEVFEGIDFLSLEGGFGFSSTEWMGKPGAKPFVITVRRAKADRSQPPTQTPLQEFSLVIELPPSMAARIIANDR